MNKKLDIIPILVFADSANKAEMLNGLLRGHGLTVKPIWTLAPQDRDGLAPELVFYFDDTEAATLDEAVEHAADANAALIVVGRERDPDAAVRALEAGATDWVCIGDDALLAAVVRRERLRQDTLRRIRKLERDNALSRELLKKQMSGSQDAIATLQEGIVVEANAACAERFGQENPQTLVGYPLMDLFAPASHPELKKAMKSVLKKHASCEVRDLALRKADGSEDKANMTLDFVEENGEEHIFIRMRGGSENNEVMQRIEALEAENERLEKETETLRQSGAGGALLRPGIFEPAASERLDSVPTGSVRALVSIQPVDPQKTLATFGAIGTAELGENLARAASPLFEEGDLATRIGDLNLLAVVTRPDEAAIEAWAAAVLEALGGKVLEGGGHSGHLDFAAGYSPVDRIRRLDDLFRQAREAATKSAPGAVSRSAAAAMETLEIDDESWEALIREALEEHRYTIALSPIEDLATGYRSWEALPRLLDREEREIGAEAFQAPAERLDLLQTLEHRLVGHAIRAVLERSFDSETTQMIVPLCTTTLADEQIFEFIADLIGRAGKSLPPKSLVLEFDIREISGRVRETGRFAERAGEAGCVMGLRGYMPGTAENRLLDTLPTECLRMAPEFIDLLMDEDADNPAATGIRDMAERLHSRGISLIATNVGDNNVMAALYNLGIGTVQGPSIGEPELLRPKK